MDDQSREIIPDSNNYHNKENEEVNECSANSEDKQIDSGSYSAVNTKTSSDKERIRKSGIENDHNTKIVSNDIEEDNACTNIEIVNNDSMKVVKNDVDLEIESKRNEIEIDVEIKVENFDAYIDENNKIYRKYNLRNADKKLKRSSLNEDKLFQNLEYQIDEIITKPTKKKDQELITTDPKPNRYYSCNICPETFETKRFLINHKEGGHGDKKLYRCFYCFKEFEKHVDFLEHKKVHKNERCFSCSKCEKAFSSEISYLKHTYNHLKPPYKCQECLFTAKQLSTIKAHVSLHSNLEKECKICKKIIHERKTCHHESFECGECGKIYTSKSSFDYHMISHTGVKRMQCLYCGKAFVTTTQLKIHTTIHTDERVYECNICYMKFTQYTNLKRHKVVHFDKRFECDYCGKKFLHKESIRFHIRLHTNYKPYKCPECSMSFVTSTHLTSHTYHVHMAKKFSCHTCNLKFATKTGLTRHVKSNSHRNKIYGTNLEECSM